MDLGDGCKVARESSGESRMCRPEFMAISSTGNVQGCMICSFELYHSGHYCWNGYLQLTKDAESRNRDRW